MSSEKTDLLFAITLKLDEFNLREKLEHARFSARDLVSEFIKQAPELESVRDELGLAGLGRQEAVEEAVRVWKQAKEREKRSWARTISPAETRTMLERLAPSDIELSDVENIKDIKSLKTLLGESNAVKQLQEALAKVGYRTVEIQHEPEEERKEAGTTSEAAWSEKVEIARLDENIKKKRVLSSKAIIKHALRRISRVARGREFVEERAASEEAGSDEERFQRLLIRYLRTLPERDRSELYLQAVADYMDLHVQNLVRFFTFKGSEIETLVNLQRFLTDERT